MPAPSLTSIILQHENSLTEAEMDFVRFYAIEGMTASAAAKLAGMEAAQGKKLLLREDIRVKVQEAFDENAQRLDVGRDDVLRGMKDAIDMARIIGDPTAMIRGWSEIGKITGLYNHTQKISVVDDPVAGKTDMKKLSTEDLVAIITGKKPFGDILEGEFVDVTPAEPAPLAEIASPAPEKRTRKRKNG